MTTKKRAAARKPTLDQVLKVLEKLYGTPVCSDRVDDPLIDHLLVGVLGCYVAPEEARAGVSALTEAFLDLNEARSSPLAELEEVLAPHIPADARRPACAALRMALQDVWDGTHGLDLEPLRGRDPEDQRAFLTDLPNTEGGPAAVVFQVALGERTMAFGPREQHLLARFGLLPRSSSPERLRKAMEKKIPVADRFRFAWLAGFGSHLCEKDEDWDPKHPFCKLLIAGNAKEVVERERAEKRAEQLRKQEEKQRQLEEARRLREEERARKAAEREEKKRLAAEARQEAAREKAEAKKKAAAKKKEQAKKKAEALKKKAAAKKKAEAKKKAAARKKVAAQKKKAADARKKAAAAKKKTAAKKKATAQKKSAAKKKAPARKKTAAKKKPTAKKKAAAKKKPKAKKKSSAKKKAAARKKPAAKKKTAARKKTPKRKTAAKKKTSARARKK